MQKKVEPGDEPERSSPRPAVSVPAQKAPGRSRAVWAVLVLALAAAAAWQYGRPLLSPSGAPGPAAGAPPPAQVTAAKPIVKTVTETFEFTGRFAPSDQVDIRSRVGGYLETIHVADGALVKKGDQLFTIDQRPIKYAIEQAEASIANAQARIDFAKNDLVRAESLRDKGVTTLALAEQRRRDLQVAQADLQQAQAAAGRARLDLEYTAIRAPFAGRVSRKNISVGNLVKIDDTVLTTLVATDPLYFYFDVDERSVLLALKPQLDALAAGKSTTPLEAQIGLIDEIDTRYKGSLDFTDNRLDEQSGTLRTRAIVANPDIGLKPGLFGRVRIPSLQPRPAVLIPDEAIGSDQDRRIVYVIGADNAVKATTVTLGPRIEGYRVIRTGLTGEETIVVNGLLRVRPGVKVAPKMTTLPAGEAEKPASKG